MGNLEFKDEWSGLAPSTSQVLLTGTFVAVGASLVYTKLRFRGSVCKSAAKLGSKTVLITGANTGIGKETALDLAQRGARVVMACRNLQKAQTAVEHIRRRTNRGELVVMQLDLASLKSVNDFCAEFRERIGQLDVLINNAGVFYTPFWKTKDGFEFQFGVNHLGHFLLTNRLLDLLKQSAPSRIIIVSSGLHKRGDIDFSSLNSPDEGSYNKAKAYADSKLANILFARELSRQLEGTGVCTYCLHPGIINTELGRYLGYSRLFWGLTYPLRWLLLKSPWYGAQTTIHCAVSEEVEGVSGRYYGECKEEAYPETKGPADGAVAKKLWEISERMAELDTKVLKK